MKQYTSIDVCGDVRCDSSGHSAIYDTYILMAKSSKLIIVFSVAQVTEVLHQMVWSKKVARGL